MSLRTAVKFSFVLASVLMIALGVNCTCTEEPKHLEPAPQPGTAEKGLPEIVFFVEKEGNSRFLSKGELETVNTAAALWNGKDKLNRIVVIAPSEIRGLLAKVVLHSHAVPAGAVEIAETADAVDWNNSTELKIIGEIPAGFSADMKKKNIKVEKIPASKLPLLPVPPETKNLAIVLGNEPLDESTPTVDLVRRTLKAVELFRKKPGTLLIFTGGQTTGRISEARMMALIAASRGLPEKAYRLEEIAMSTIENAELTAKMVAGRKFDSVYIVSKSSHFKVALSYFRDQPGFKDAEPVDCGITKKEILENMESHYRATGSKRTKRRIDALRAGRHGVD